jgi:hypothetical protein
VNVVVCHATKLPRPDDGAVLVELDQETIVTAEVDDG